MNLQPHLHNEKITLMPLSENDFERLFAVAADPLIWEQHPNKDRYKREVFQNFFQGAIQSKGAFLVSDSQSGEIIGSTRFYDYDAENRTVLIGYTFLARSHWGGIYNPSMKALMLEHAFQFVDKVQLHVGSNNIRSQRAVERLGAKKIAELEVAYFGEPKKLNFVFEITKR